MLFQSQVAFATLSSIEKLVSPVCTQLSCSLVSRDHEASNLSAQEDELKVQQKGAGHCCLLGTWTRRCGSRRCHSLQMTAIILAPLFHDSRSLLWLQGSQHVLNSEFWTDGSHPHRPRDIRGQRLCSPLDMVWMYGGVYTTCSFQCWKKDQFATFFTPALWRLAGGSKKQARPGVGAGEQGQSGAQHPLGQHCPAAVAGSATP